MTSREEVAKKLREAGKELDKNAPGHVNGAAQSVLFELFEATSVRDSNSYSDAFNRLADLIDPTCVNIAVPNDTSPFVCSKCGYGGICFKPCGIHMDKTSDWTNLLPQFCPACGSRVVRDD